MPIHAPATGKIGSVTGLNWSRFGLIVYENFNMPRVFTSKRSLPGNPILVAIISSGPSDRGTRHIPELVDLSTRAVGLCSC